MKRANLRYIAPITISLLIPFGLFAATQFVGPTESPTGGNTPGVIWDMSAGGTQSATINISGPATINGATNLNGTISTAGTVVTDIKLSSSKALKVDVNGSANYNVGNWGGSGGTQRPLTFNINGDLKAYGFGGYGVGESGTIYANQFCFHNNNCVNTTWPSGGGGGVTSIANGGGLTVTNPSGPATTLSVIDNYVNTTGDTMTGKLILNWPGYRALEVNGGNGGGGAVYGNNTMANGFGGEFYGAYGVYATTPMSASGYYAGYFHGYSGGVNALGSQAGGVGITASNPGAGSIAVKGYAQNGYGGLFQDSTYWSYVGGQGYSLYSNGYLNNLGNASIGGTLGVTGNLTASNNICLGGVCRNSWPSASTGDISSVTAGNGLTGGATTGDATINVGAGSGINVAADSISVAAAGGYGSLQFNNSGTLGASNSLFWDNGNSRLGIGTQVPSYRLDVSGSANLNKGIGYGATALMVNSAEALWYNGTYFSWGYGGSANYFADNVGIGVTAPTYQLQLSANSAAKPGSNTWTIASDKRLKDVKGDYSKGLAEVLKLKPITYSYKEKNPYNYSSNEVYVGAIAQDVERIFPEAVSKDSNGYLQLDTNSISWASVNAIKELKAENDDLKARIEKLEAKLGN